MSRCALSAGSPSFIAVRTRVYAVPVAASDGNGDTVQPLRFAEPLCISLMAILPTDQKLFSRINRIGIDRPPCAFLQSLWL